MIELARSNVLAKRLLVQLANRGYYLVRMRKGHSDFVPPDVLKRLCALSKSKPIQHHEGIFYTITPPVLATSRPRLLVVFSSVADVPYSSDIVRRNFFTNFANIQKYVPANTAVLRISDIGGVVGSFYLNNNASDLVEKSVGDVIRLAIAKVGALDADVVLYGASKGGTAALFHGIDLGLKTVAVDPIVSDEHYEKKYSDLHFTQDTFHKPKQIRFAELLSERPARRATIICSPRSPQHQFISEIIRRHPSCGKIAFFETQHTAIKDHVDVGPNTINVLTMILNGYFYGVLNEDALTQVDLA